MDKETLVVTFFSFTILMLLIAVAARSIFRFFSGRLKKAASFFNSENYAKARELYEELYDTTRNPEYLYKSALCDFELKNFKQAYSQFEKLLVNSGETNSLPEKLILKYMIRCCLRTNEIDRIDKLITGLDFNIDKDTFCVYAEKLVEMKRYGQAMDIYEKILKKDSANITALKGTARICDIQKEYNSAILYYRKILSARPEFNEIYYELGKIYKKSKNYISAIEILMKGLGISNGDLKFNILAALAHCFIENEEYEAAVEHLLLGATEFKGDKEKRLELLYLLGLCYFNMKRLPEAKKVWTEVHKVNPNYVDISQMLDKLYTPKSAEDIINYLNKIDKTAANRISEELCRHFNLHLTSYNYKKNAELLITANDKNDRIIMSVKLWQNASGDIVLFDFKEFLNANNAKRGILILPAGFSGGEQSHGGDNGNIIIISKIQFAELFNKILRTVVNA